MIPPCNSRASDTFSWRVPQRTYTESFPTKGTWDQIRVTAPRVPWPKVVWFKEAIPRFSFIHWLTLLDRLPMHDRLCSWGMNVPARCVLCDSPSESNRYMFFECNFIRPIWTSLVSRVVPNPPLPLPDTTAWIMNTPPVSAP
ncbi:hypothetical protein V5N11_017023 [Cardamine amara subsp. amara]|uniref:Reverse transcriptase zinc-binding domain-containing protein n=1 Tax=Cardamine amara subsp. amara TaxID=228776 RepID=A0ABD1BFL3_CARAN